MKREAKSWLRSFLLELILYAGLVVAYFFLVLAYLGNWLHRLFEHERRTYAFVALGLIIGQGFVLEVLTRALLAWIKPARKD